MHPDDYGPCCCCGGTDRVRNLVMMPRLAPVPGKGWGCLRCGLPNDGAMYVACDACMDERREPVEVCAGWVVDRARVPVGDLAPGAFEHDMARHPGEV